MPIIMRVPPNVLILFSLSLSVALNAAPVDFVRDVRPIFERRCYDCHGETKQKGGLRLDLKVAAMKGGDKRSPDIISGNAKKSPLIELVTSSDLDERMPPKGDALTAAEIALLSRWIDEGSLWPDGVDRAKVIDKRDHWSLKPLTHPTPPQTQDQAWPRNEIDQFVLAKMEQQSLRPAPAADRVSWLRRVSFDLTGLPPTPEMAAAFQADHDDGAEERVVDELLKSPRYGEHWAQHWLDVVRYADTHGFEVNTERPNAWPYRDYVIRAFNRDTPYNRFIEEQLIGESVGADAATGFLVTASVLLPGQIGKDEPSIRLARQDSLDEIVVNLSQTFLGLSVGCARCHDHKFDPIPQRDYYAMQAFVAGVEYLDRDLHTPEAEAMRAEEKRLSAQKADLARSLSRFVPLAKAGHQRPPVNAKENTDRFAPVAAKRLRFTILATNNLEPCIDELEVFNSRGANIALASAGAVVRSSGDTVVANRHDLRHLNDGLYGNSRSWMSNETGKGWVVVEWPNEQLVDRIVWGRDREGKFADRLATDYRVEIATGGGPWQVVADATDRDAYVKGEKKAPAFSTQGLTTEEAKEATRLMNEQRSVENQLSAAHAAQKAFLGTFRKPDEIHLLNRGDPEQPQELVEPAVLSALGPWPLPKNMPEQARRKALADWIASPQNPLTARVMANRIWQWHFGTGLVDTPSDFGHNGARPSHPELLDWLAGEFMRSGWSVKQMHKRIVLSAAYRQSSRIEPTAQAKDADARLLWRYPSHRIEAESIRDSMLFVSGRLNLKMYGRGFDLFDKRGGLSGFKPVESYSGDGLRRMIYAHKVRREREAVFGSFDCPDAGQSTARRRESTTPIQALDLFNSRFTMDESAAFAARVKRELHDANDADAQVRRAYQLALSRDPTKDEASDAASIIHEHGLATLCRALFNSNEFLFVP